MINVFETNIELSMVKNRNCRPKCFWVHSSPQMTSLFNENHRCKLAFNLLILSITRDSAHQLRESVGERSHEYLVIFGLFNT